MCRGVPRRRLLRRTTHAYRIRKAQKGPGLLRLGLSELIAFLTSVATGTADVAHPNVGLLTTRLDVSSGLSAARQVPGQGSHQRPARVYPRRWVR
jgi:hypothetical protein